MELATAYRGGFIGKTHYFALRVYIEDTDLGGVVYHANYLRFLERARSDMLRAVGIDHRAAIEHGEGVYAVTEVNIKYRRPARFDDELVVLTQLEEIGAVACSLAQNIMRQDELIAEALVRIAFLSPAGRPQRQPADWLKKFRQVVTAAE